MTKSKSYTLDDPEVLKSESNRLNVQAEKLFECDLPSLKRLVTVAPERILELGCGNAGYLSMLRKAFPKSRLFGLDRNEALLVQGRKRLKNASLIHCDLNERTKLRHLLGEVAPRLVVARFLFQHLTRTEIENLLSDLYDQLPRPSTLIVIDVDDTKTSFVPNCDVLHEMIDRKMKKQSFLGGDRKIGSSVSKVLNPFFDEVQSEVVDYNFDNVGRENWASIFLPIISSGLDPKSDADNKLLTSAADWFARANESEEYRASYPCYFTAGFRY